MGVKGGEDKMTEWQVITALITLIGGAAVIVRPILNLTKAITELTSTCKQLDRQFSDFEDHNRESHRRLWDHNDKQDKILQRHENRILILEGEKHNEED